MRAPGSYTAVADSISKDRSSEGKTLVDTPDREPSPEASVPSETGRNRPEAGRAPLASESTQIEEGSTLEKPGGKKEKKKGKDKAKAGSPKGIETMFRTSYRTHLDLSNLADTKANIMISINGIIISILFASTSSSVLLQSRLFLLPTGVLLVFCLLSLVYAVLAARPRVTRKETTLDQIKEGKANILFFGNFTSLAEEEFVDGMEHLIREPERAYRNMIRDIYGLGSVLETKYRLLRTSYTIFMFGLIAGVLLFLVALVWGSGQPMQF